ncbi:MAG: efflux RND transporter periplasmic adaptor subunit [Deltaproteobacteria bacterium]|nr:efflux RND transporter periplasmic adaptor subunit [Deltaproteobacteria bacterium]
MKLVSLVVLVALVALASPAIRAQDHGGHGSHPAEPKPSSAPQTPPDRAWGRAPPGYAEIEISADRQQLIGLKVAEAKLEKLSATIRASAVVQPDETKDAHVHSKLMGWVAKLHANTVGQRVKEGEPLYALYSQELFAAQNEYVRALKSSPELAEAAATRLRLWGVPEDQLRLIQREGPRQNILFRAPRSGTIIEKNLLEGHYVEPDMMLFRITDLSTVWVLAEVYEFEVNRVALGGVAAISVQGVLEPLAAKVDYVYPTLNPETRTVRIRLVATNGQGLLRPGSFATAELPVRAVEGVFVPEEAVIDTGERQVVYEALQNGRFRPILVSVGRRVSGRIEILEGLSAGTQVVVSAQFLVDSESRLRGVSEPGRGHGAH